LPEEPGAKFTRYVRKDGRITVPNEVMKALGLKEGDIVEFTVRKIKHPIEEDPMKGRRRRD
jgi:AbrB family looped-hinge helix DNA binding protein